MVWSTDLAGVHSAVGIHDTVPHCQPNHEVADNDGHDPDRQVQKDVHSETVAALGQPPQERGRRWAPVTQTCALMPRVGLPTLTRRVREASLFSPAPRVATQEAEDEDYHNAQGRLAATRVLDEEHDADRQHHSHQDPCHPVDCSPVHMTHRRTGRRRRPVRKCRWSGASRSCRCPVGQRK